MGQISELPKEFEMEKITSSQFKEINFPKRLKNKKKALNIQKDEKIFFSNLLKIDKPPKKSKKKHKKDKSQKKQPDISINFGEIPELKKFTKLQTTKMPLSSKSTTNQDISPKHPKIIINGQVMNKEIKKQNLLKFAMFKQLKDQLECINPNKNDDKSDISIMFKDKQQQMKSFYKVNSSSNISDISTKNDNQFEEKDFYVNLKKKNVNPAMAGLMAVLMKEIAIMEAEGYADDDAMLPKSQKHLTSKHLLELGTQKCSIDTLEINEEYQNSTNLCNKMKSLDITQESRFQLFQYHPKKLFPLNKIRYKNGQ